MRIHLIRAIRITGFILVMLLGISQRPGHSADISYIYDALGRLVGVVDPASETATYQYDAVGNLLSITRHASSTVSVITFSPSSGPTGTTVTISGAGFSTTPSQNSVQFNGLAANVTSATATELVTQVPSGATTGTITVTTPTGSASSGSAFTVVSGQSPVIATFFPTVGPLGTVVTVTGSNFETTATRNRVIFGGLLAVVNSSSSSNIETVAPASGKITVATVYGQATSTDDYFLTPQGILPTDVNFTGRITVGGSSVTASISTAGKVALVLFDGLAGQRVSLAMTGITITSSTVSVRKPDGTELATKYSVNNTGGSLDSPALPVTGTYIIMIKPEGSYAGNMTLTLSADVTGTIAINGGAVPVGKEPAKMPDTVSRAQQVSRSVSS
ncbi:IPT/TIG domain-containing protein [Candidatus Nitrospira bockiana]